MGHLALKAADSVYHKQEATQWKRRKRGKDIGHGVEGVVGNGPGKLPLDTTRLNARTNSTRWLDCGLSTIVEPEQARAYSFFILATPMSPVDSPLF